MDIQPPLPIQTLPGPDPADLLFGVNDFDQTVCPIEGRHSDFGGLAGQHGSIPFDDKPGIRAVFLPGQVQVIVSESVSPGLEGHFQLRRFAEEFPVDILLKSVEIGLGRNQDCNQGNQETKHRTSS